MEGARLLEDDAAARVAARPADVPVVRVGPGPRVAAFRVVGIEVVRPRTVGGEEDPGADPHRVPVGPRVVGDLRQLPGHGVEHVEVLSPATGVALPGTEVPEERRIDQPNSVRGPGAGPGAGHRQGGSEPSAPWNLVEPPLADPVSVPERAEEDLLAVGRPVVDDVVVGPAGRKRPGGGVEGQLFRNTASGRHDVDLFVAVVLPGEGDLAAVRREPGEEFLPRVGGQPHRGPAGGRGGPEVAGVGEDDAVPVDVRKAEEPGFGTGRMRQRSKDGDWQDPDWQDRNGDAHGGFPRGQDGVGGRQLAVRPRSGNTVPVPQCGTDRSRNRSAAPRTRRLSPGPIRYFAAQSSRHNLRPRGGSP